MQSMVKINYGVSNMYARVFVDVYCDRFCLSHFGSLLESDDHQRGSIKCPHGTMESLGLFVILRGCLGVAANFGSFVSDAVNFGSLLVVRVIRGWGVHVKDGPQTACRHNLIFTHLWCVFQHSLLSVGSASYHPIMSFLVEFWGLPP